MVFYKPYVLIDQSTAAGNRLSQVKMGSFTQSWLVMTGMKLQELKSIRNTSDVLWLSKKGAIASGRRVDKGLALQAVPVEEATAWITPR